MYVMATGDADGNGGECDGDVRGDGHGGCLPWPCDGDGVGELLMAAHQGSDLPTALLETIYNDAATPLPALYSMHSH